MTEQNPHVERARGLLPTIESKRYGMNEAIWAAELLPYLVEEIDRLTRSRDAFARIARHTDSGCLTTKHAVYPIGLLNPEV